MAVHLFPDISKCKSPVGLMRGTLHITTEPLPHRPLNPSYNRPPGIDPKGTEAISKLETSRSFS